MRYYEFIIMENVAKINYAIEFKDGDLIMGIQERVVKDLSLFKIHTQQINATKKLCDFYLPSANLSMRELVSTKAKTFFDAYRKDNIRYYPCPVIRGKVHIDGYWITDKLIFDDDWVDFNKSDFIYVNRQLIKAEGEQRDTYEKKVKTVSFKDLAHLKEFKEKEMWFMDELHPHKIFIKEGCPYQILAVPSTGIFHLIVTEEVKTQLQKQKMDKGIEFKPLEIPEEEWGGPHGLRKQFYN